MTVERQIVERHRPQRIAGQPIAIRHLHDFEVMLLCGGEKLGLKANEVQQIDRIITLRNILSDLEFLGLRLVSANEANTSDALARNVLSVDRADIVCNRSKSRRQKSASRVG